MSAGTWSPKTPEEEDVRALTFVRVLAAGETITGAVVEVIVVTGTDPNPAALVSSTSVVSPEVRMLLVGGVVGNVYELKAKITTSMGRTLVGCGYVGIEEC